MLGEDMGDARFAGWQRNQRLGDIAAKAPCCSIFPVALDERGQRSTQAEEQRQYDELALASCQMDAMNSSNGDAGRPSSASTGTWLDAAATPDTDRSPRRGFSRSRAGWCCRSARAVDQHDKRFRHLCSVIVPVSGLVAHARWMFQRSCVLRPSPAHQLNGHRAPGRSRHTHSLPAGSAWGSANTLSIQHQPADEQQRET